MVTLSYKPIKGGTYIPLPDFIMKKRAILNMEIKLINVFSGQYYGIFIQLKNMLHEFQTSKNMKMYLILKE